MYRKKLEFYRKLRAQMEELAKSDLGLPGNSPDNPVVIEVYDKLPNHEALRRNYISLDPMFKR